MAAILFSRAIGPVPISVVLREVHSSTIGITELPIETGAKITDHAYVEPKKLALEFADSNAVATFNSLVRFQESRVPFVIVSGFAVYKNMLIKSLDVTRDAQYSQVLMGRAELQEAIIVGTAYTVSQDGQGQGLKGGNPGGAKSTNAVRPSTGSTPANAGQVASDRAAGTVMRGDAMTQTVPANQNTSILSRLVP